MWLSAEKTVKNSNKKNPLKSAQQASSPSTPDLGNELKKASQDYERSEGAKKEKARQDVQKFSEEKKRQTGDANPPA